MPSDPKPITASSLKAKDCLPKHDLRARRTPKPRPNPRGLLTSAFLAQGPKKNVGGRAGGWKGGRGMKKPVSSNGIRRRTLCNGGQPCRMVRHGFSTDRLADRLRQVSIFEHQTPCKINSMAINCSCWWGVCVVGQETPGGGDGGQNILNASQTFHAKGHN